MGTSIHCTPVTHCWVWGWHIFKTRDPLNWAEVWSDHTHIVHLSRPNACWWASWKTEEGCYNKHGRRIPSCCVSCMYMSTVMSLIIQLLEHPPFPGKTINYCIPSIRTSTFQIIHTLRNSIEGCWMSTRFRQSLQSLNGGCWMSTSLRQSMDCLSYNIYSVFVFNCVIIDLIIKQFH